LPQYLRHYISLQQLCGQARILCLMTCPSSIKSYLNEPLPKVKCEDIAAELEHGTLVACSDGAHDPN
jgi:hypothetical protein